MLITVLRMPYVRSISPQDIRIYILAETVLVLSTTIRELFCPTLNASERYPRECFSVLRLILFTQRNQYWINKRFYEIIYIFMELKIISNTVILRNTLTTFFLKVHNFVTFAGNCITHIIFKKFCRLSELPRYPNFEIIWK